MSEIKYYITSGFWNPVHLGHIKLLENCKKIAGPNGKLLVITNNDIQVKIKNSPPLLTEDERMGIMSAIKYADEVILSIDTEDGTVTKTIEMLAKKYGKISGFLKGGDRSSSSAMPPQELEVCEKYGIEIVYGCAPIGGSSTEIKNRLLKK